MINFFGSDLGRMYDLCAKVESGLTDLKVALEAHVLQQGLSAVEKAADQALLVCDNLTEFSIPAQNESDPIFLGSESLRQYNFTRA